MLNNDPFYFDLIKKYTSMFGVIFHDIKIYRTDSVGNITKTIKVPLEFGPKDKMLARVLQDPNLDRPSAMTTLPAMSFEMGDIIYDSSRKISTTHRFARPSTTSPGQMSYQYNPVPFDIEYKLHIAAKFVADGTKIIEQILPFFTPDWTPTVELIPQMNVVRDIPVVFSGITHEDSYDGKFKDRRAITWTINFVVKGWLFGPVKDSKVIKFVNTNFYSVSSTYDNVSDAVGRMNPSERMTIQPGLTANGQPTSNVNNTIPYTEIEVTDDYGYITIITDQVTGNT